jgi:thioredoxin-like negative regulator of GroEL
LSPQALTTAGLHKHAEFQAKQLHQKGDLQQAEELYHAIISNDSENADAHHLLGALILAKYGVTEVCNKQSLCREQGILLLMKWRGVA